MNLEQGGKGGEPGKLGHLKPWWERGNNRVPKGCQWAWGFLVQLVLEAGGGGPGIVPVLCEEPFRGSGPRSSVAV